MATRSLYEQLAEQLERKLAVYPRPNILVLHEDDPVPSEVKADEVIIFRTRIKDNALNKTP